MVRFSQIVLTYLVVGAVMWGGGALELGETGPVQTFVGGEPGNLTTNKSTQEVSQTGTAIDTLVGQFSGGLVIVWDLASGFIKFLNWPLVTMLANNAPPSLTLLLGVPLTAAFYLSLIRLVRTSA